MELAFGSWKKLQENASLWLWRKKIADSDSTYQERGGGLLLRWI